MDCRLDCKLQNWKCELQSDRTNFYECFVRV